jgi:hypothetical protein
MIPAWFGLILKANFVKKGAIAIAQSLGVVLSKSSLIGVMDLIQVDPELETRAALTRRQEHLLKKLLPPIPVVATTAPLQDNPEMASQTQPSAASTTSWVLDPYQAESTDPVPPPPSLPLPSAPPSDDERMHEHHTYTHVVVEMFLVLSLSPQLNVLSR